MIPFDQLKTILETVPYGEAMVVKRHEGKNTLVDVNLFETIKYDSNEAFAAQLLQLIKDYDDKKFTGDMTFTITWRKGNIDRVIRQGFRRLDAIDEKAK